jgi:hypothetical protein
MKYSTENLNTINFFLLFRNDYLLNIVGLSFQTDAIRGTERLRLRKRVRRKPTRRSTSSPDWTQGLRLPVDCRRR